MSDKDKTVLKELIETANELGRSGTVEMLRFGQGMIAGKATQEREKQSEEDTK